jgi:hypothetical protein
MPVWDKLPFVPCPRFLTQGTPNRVLCLSWTSINTCFAKGALAHWTNVWTPPVSCHISFERFAAHCAAMAICHSFHLSMVADTSCIHCAACALSPSVSESFSVSSLTHRVPVEPFKRTKLVFHHSFILQFQILAVILQFQILAVAQPSVFLLLFSLHNRPNMPCLMSLFPFPPQLPSHAHRLSLCRWFMQPVPTAPRVSPGLCAIS